MKGILMKPDVWVAKKRVLEQYGEAQTRRLITPQPDADGGLTAASYKEALRQRRQAATAAVAKYREYLRRKGYRGRAQQTNDSWLDGTRVFIPDEVEK